MRIHRLKKPLYKMCSSRISIARNWSIPVILALGQDQNSNNTDKLLTSAYIKLKYRNLLAKHITTRNNILRIELHGVYLIWSNGTSKMFSQSFQIFPVKSLHNAVRMVPMRMSGNTSLVIFKTREKPNRYCQCWYTHVNVMLLRV
jgi:hypothetical protein